MIYLPEELIWHIMSFFDITISVEINCAIKTLNYKAIEILFLSMTNKDLNKVVKKYSNKSKLTVYSIQEYYFNSINNFNMILELESLNMRTIPYENMDYFWLKISKNPGLLMYLHYNQLYFSSRLNYEYIEFESVKSGLMLGTVIYLLSHINDEKLIFFLRLVEDDFERKRKLRGYSFGMCNISGFNVFTIVENNTIENNTIENKELLKWTQWINKPKKILKKPKKIDCPQKIAWVNKSNFKPSKFKNTRRETT